jgi:hypothetical protein
MVMELYEDKKGCTKREVENSSEEELWQDLVRENGKRGGKRLCFGKKIW